MRRFGFSAALWLWAVLPAVAQVTVEVVTDQNQFLPGESLPVAVKITNLSGQTLHLGAEPDWLTFLVESRDGFVVRQLGEVPVAGEFALESSKRAIKRADLAPYFTLPQVGRYTITATVRIKEWGREVTSKPANIDVIQGAKLWEQEFGLPLKPGATNATPEIRKYILQQANYLKGQIRLYARVVDPAAGQTIKVRTIGPMVSFSRPEAQVDKSSNLHVLYQNGPYTFNYTVLNPDGDVLVNDFYEHTGNRPRLKGDDEGKITVAGGLRRPGPDEPEPVVPPLVAPTETNATLKAEPKSKKSGSR